MARQRQNIEGSLKDLIDAHFLKVGEEVECRPPKRTGGIRKAHLQIDGSVKDKDSGQVYSLAQWSNLVKENSSNAWIQVTARDKKLSYFRKMLNDGVKPPQESHSHIVPEPDTEGLQNGVQSDVESFQSELDTLKSQLSNQQSEIAGQSHLAIIGILIALTYLIQ